MLTEAIQSSRLHSTIHDRHTTHLWTGQCCRRRSVWRLVSHCTTVLRRIGRIAEERRRVPDPSAVEHRPAARETTNPRYHKLHLLRYLSREILTVHSSPLRLQVFQSVHGLSHPGTKATEKLGAHAFCVARRTKGLSHLGTCLPVLPALHSLPPHSHSTGRLYTAGSTISARPHRPRGALSDVILPHCSRPFQPLAGSRPHPGHLSRHRGTRPADRLDIPLRLPTNHHH
jgi:hypothetical protein